MIDLVPDILSEIMSRLPRDINQKFTFAQVSRYWREVALQDHLFWSSFTGGPSKQECYRVPMLLERCGNAPLHVELHLNSGHIVEWHADALKALVPYASRIETLELEFWVYSNYSLPDSTTGPLLNSGLEFPALRTLRLEGPTWGRRPSLLFSAQGLRTLDVERFSVKPASWRTILSPSLETIRMHEAPGVEVEAILDVFERCPNATSIALDAGGGYDTDHEDEVFEAFRRQRPLAPALRELKLGTSNPDLGRILKAAFPDIVLPVLSACLYNSDVDVLSEALLPGVGPLVYFELASGAQVVELRDDAGLIRRFECWNDDSSFEMDWTWDYLCEHHNLHKTVREIRTAHWEDLADAVERIPPQLPDGITFVYPSHWHMRWPLSAGEEGEEIEEITKTLSIAGLSRIEFVPDADFVGDRPQMVLKTVLCVLAHIESLPGREIEVCMHSGILLTTDEEVDAFEVLRAAVLQRTWRMCSQCLERRLH